MEYNWEGTNEQNGNGVLREKGREEGRGEYPRP